MKTPRNAAANHAIEFISNLTLTGDYSNQPFRLRSFQESIIRRLFGTLDRNGRRAIKKSCWLLPRKCGKSQLAAAVLIYALLTFPPGQQIYSVARDRKQAAVIFDLAAQMLRQDPELMEHFGVEIVDSACRIVVPSRHSFYAALSKEHKGNKLGKNPSVLLFDEAQELDDKQHAAMMTGMGSRSEPLVIYIMTGGERKEGIGWDIAEYAKKIEAGIIDDPTFLPCLYYAKDEEEDQWDQESLWRRCIPALDDFVSFDFIRTECEQAKHLPRLEADFKRYYLNIWQSPSHSWIKDIDWMANAAKPLGCGEYVAGLDVASVNDTSGLVLFGRNSAGTFDVLPTYWVCERQIRERTSAEASYQMWSQTPKGAMDKFLRVTPGEAQDQERILADVLAICRQYGVRKLGVDRWGMQWLGPKILQQVDPDEMQVGAVGQHMQEISEPLKQLERLVLHRQLRHGGHPVMRWQCSNARVIRDQSENIRLDKRGSERMDGIQALAMAVSLWDWGIGGNKRSVYEDRGILTLTS